MRLARVAAWIWVFVLLGCAQRVPTFARGSDLAMLAQGLERAGKPGTAGANEPDGSLSLAAAYRLALARADEVAIAQAAVREGAIRHREKLTEVAPNANLTATAVFRREQVVGTTVLAPGEQLVAAASVQQPLFRRGFFASRAAGEHRRDAANAAFGRAKQQLARDVVEVFIDVLRSRKLVELADSAAARAKAQHDHAVNRVKAGNALKSVELLALVDLRRAERQRVVARRDLGEAEAAFHRVIGRPPPQQLERPTVPTALPDRARALELVRARQDVRALQLRVAEARSEADAAAGRRWWPRLDLDATFQYTSPEIFGRSYDWRVLGILTIPLLQTGREHTELALRENETHVAKLELERLLKVIGEEIERATVRVELTAQAADLAASQLQAATDLYKLVDRQFKLGAITFLEVTNAQAVLVEAENTFEVTQMERVGAVYDYLFVVGALELDGAGP